MASGTGRLEPFFIGCVLLGVALPGCVDDSDDRPVAVSPADSTGRITILNESFTIRGGLNVTFPVILDRPATNLILSVTPPDGVYDGFSIDALGDCGHASPGTGTFVRVNGQTIVRSSNLSNPTLLCGDEEAGSHLVTLRLETGIATGRLQISAEFP